jgi:protoheme IX farnesyltransferase
MCGQQAVARTFKRGFLKRVHFHQFAWGVLSFDVLVILWGAFVRATHSGAGCGSHWPTCNGDVIPLASKIETVVEFAHRTTSGLSFLLAVALFVWAYRKFSSDHLAFRASALALGFTLTEALIGMVLVLAGLVADDRSPMRAVVMSAHLVNTFFLLAALTVAAWSSTTGRRFTLRHQGAVGLAVWVGVVCTILLGITGAVAALGDTLFPAGSLVEGFRQDHDPAAHFLLRLRPLHPLLAASVGLYVLLLAGLLMHLRPSEPVRRVARVMCGLFGAQIVVGLVNLLLLAPIPMQIVHLLFAELGWISLVTLGAEAFVVGLDHVESQDVAAAARPDLVHAPLAGRASWKDYVALTKPRVVSLLLFTTLAAMIIAKGGWPGWVLFLAVAVGGYMSAGAANAINMVIDRDIDVRMDRTAKRPTVTQQIPSRDALLFAYALAGASFALLWGAANLLTAMLAFAGLVCYVIVYTLYLKRRTWNNIVIGGAAGAFPPLVGWAAVTGDLNLFAWSLFGIVFLWTPVHFWALALLLKDDYARAGVPMLPVVLGERVTVIQIGFYTVLTVVISAVPLLLGETGRIYLLAAAALNALLMLRSLQLYQRPDRPRASSLFKYSMTYLALLFLAMAVDRSTWM